MTVQPASATSATEELDLATALDGLAGLMLGDVTLGALLTVVAGFAATAIPGADGAGVTMLHEAGGADTIVASETFVRHIDAIQYRLGEGPCISATSSGRTTRSAALADDRRWPRFGSQAAGSGVNSVISLPLVIAGDVLGSLNVYAFAPDAFGASAQVFGERFAEAAAVAVGNARRLDQQQQTVGRLQDAAGSRSVIDQALGVLVERDAISAADALVRLQTVGRQADIDVVTVAHRLVAESAARSPSSLPPLSRPPDPVLAAEGGDPGSGSFVVAADAGAVDAVRDGVRRLLVAHRMGGDALDDVDLLTAEVVSNLLRHEHPTVSRVDVTFEGDATVTVTLAGGITGPSMSLTHPVTPAGPASESGRGLGILDALASTWGTHRQHRTTAVWFTVRDDSPAPEPVPPPPNEEQVSRGPAVRAAGRQGGTGDGPSVGAAPAFDALRRSNAYLRRSGHHDRAVARALQDAMLTRLPEPGHLRLAARYLTADTDDKVGGDWYDAVVHPSGATTLVIGDVMGHDIAAAAFMGQIRNVLRAIVVDRDERPGAVLARLDRAMRELGIDTLVTVLLMRVGPARSGRAQGVPVRWASAGHPPPVVALADGTVSVLDGENDLLLGVRPGTTRRDHVHVLPPGSTLLLYTDGLVESRHQDIATGQRRLVGAVGTHRDLAPGSFLDAVLAQTVGAHPDDDVAVLAARHPGRR